MAHIRICSLGRIAGWGQKDEQNAEVVFRYLGTRASRLQ
jgi:hypothetical protein